MSFAIGINLPDCGTNVSAVGPEAVDLKKGDVLLIRAGTPHRFKNPGRQQAVTFNVYSPPEYPPDTKG